MTADALRLDKWLWFARIVKKRAWAQAMAESGHLRVDGRPIDRAATPVRVGQILSFATRSGRVRAIRVRALPSGRVAAEAAAACYEELLGAGDANVSQEIADR